MLFKTSKFALIVTLSSFVAAALFDPGDQILHLKVPLFLCALSLWAARVALGMVGPGNYKTWTAVLLFALVLPGIASIIGLLGDTLPTGEPRFAVLKGFSVLLLIPVLSSEKIDLTKHIIRWSFVVAVFTIALVVLSLKAPLIFAAAEVFFVEKDSVMINSRDVVGFGIGSFYYKTVAVVVLPIAYYFWNLLHRPRKVVSLVLTLIFLGAALCSGSRATALGAFVIVVAFVFQKLKARLGLRSALAALFIMVVLPAGYFASYFHPGESSNSIKLGHLHSYVVEFDENPTYLLWGQGADTEFYSEGFQTKTTITELTYLELIRGFGIPVTALILIALFYPVLGLERYATAMPYLAVPYAAYLWEAASNPLLIGSTGLLIVSAIWGVVLMEGAKQAKCAPEEAPI